jgi:hypothetical protein
VSTYRDDLEAAQSRADAADAEAERLRKEVERLKAPRDDEGEVPIPERFNVMRTANELTVKWRWFRVQHLFLLFFVIAWDSFLLFWYFGFPSDLGGLLFKIFPIAHVAVGVGLTYYVITGFVNRTLISAQRGLLRVSHGPLPWRGNHNIRREDIKQLFVTDQQHRRTDRDTNVVTTMTSFDLCALLESGKELRLLRRLETLAQARYLERTFEQHLGIDDRRIAGEAARE